ARDGSIMGYGPYHEAVFESAAPLIAQIIDALNAGTFTYPLPALVAPPASRLWVNSDAAAVFDSTLTMTVINTRLTTPTQVVPIIVVGPPSAFPVAKFP